MVSLDLVTLKFAAIRSFIEREIIMGMLDSDPRGPQNGSFDVAPVGAATELRLHPTTDDANPDGS